MEKYCCSLSQLSCSTKKVDLRQQELCVYHNLSIKSYLLSKGECLRAAKCTKSLNEYAVKKRGDTNVLSFNIQVTVQTSCTGNHFNRTLYTVMKIITKPVQKETMAQQQQQTEKREKTSVQE